MGSGLVKIPVGSALFYVIKFGIIAAVLGLGVSAWRRAKLRNEPPTDYLKLALFVPFTIDFHLHYAFIFLTIILFNKKLLLPWNSPLKPIYLIFLWGFISYVINQFIEFNPLSFPLFVGTFFLPWIFFALVIQSNSKIYSNEVIFFFINIVLILFTILCLQILSLWELNPDFRTGGTANAHTAATFISIAFIISFYHLLNKRFKKKIELYKMLIVLCLTLPILYLLDAKYILVWLILTLCCTVILFYMKQIKIKVSVIFIICLITIFWYQFSDRNLLLSQNAARFDSFHLDTIINNFPATPKAQLINDGINMLKNDPLVFFIGSGPGTFFSRAANSRSNDRLIGIVSYGANYFEKRTKLPEAIKPFNSWIRIKYGDFSKTKHGAFSSIFDHRSSFINIYFEIGILGLIIFMVFLFQFIKTGIINLKNKSNFGFELLTLTLFALLMGMFELWYEQPQFLIIISLFIALFNEKIEKQVGNF